MTARSGNGVIEWRYLGHSPFRNIVDHFHLMNRLLNTAKERFIFPTGGALSQDSGNFFSLSLEQYIQGFPRLKIEEILKGHAAPYSSFSYCGLWKLSLVTLSSKRDGGTKSSDTYQRWRIKSFKATWATRWQGIPLQNCLIKRRKIVVGSWEGIMALFYWIA